MEPILINRCRYEDRTFRSCSRRLLRPRLVLLWLLNAIVIGYPIYVLIRYYPVLPQLPPYLFVVQILMLLMGLFGIFRTLRLVDSGVKLQLRRVQEQYQVSFYDETAAFLDKEITTESSVRSDQYHLAYDSIWRIYRCRETIAVMSKARITTILDPARFENGTETDFWKLMTEKCPKAVPRKYRMDKDGERPRS